jgi:hypothetical protein
MVIVMAGALLLTACAAEESVGRAPAPDSDSEQRYEYYSQVTVDDNVYEIRGIVAGELESLVRQTEAARGSVAGSGFGFFGTYFGPELGGKGFVRLLVQESNSDLAPVGETVILKVTDTKAIVLVPGDSVTFRCRAQYEAIAAVREQETFDSEKLATWELDYCRLLSPVIEAAQ